MKETAPRAEQAQRYDLQALFQTSQALSSSSELYSFLGNLLLTAMGRLLVTRGIALLYNSGERKWHAIVVKGIPEIKEGDYLELPPLTQDAVASGDALPAALRSLGIHLLLPIREEREEVGAIALGSKLIGGYFEKTELEFVQSMVNMSAAAVRNSLVVEKLRQTNLDLDNTVQQLNTLFELSKEFNATVDRERVLKIFSFALMGHMVVQNHLFYLKRPENTFELVSSGRTSADALDLEFLSSVEDLVRAEPGDILDQNNMAIALPIQQQGSVHGVLCLGAKMNRAPYYRNDIEFLYALGSLAVTSIQNAELVEERIARQRLEEELRMAREIQRNLLPASIPKIPGLEVATLALPSREVGGDYFDIVSITKDRTLFMIADVTGKGAPAALLMSSIHACTHVMLPMDLTLQEAIERTNSVLYENTAADKFITAFAAIYYPDRSLSFVNAGHEAPLLIRANGEVEHLKDGGPLLGIIPSVPYFPGYITLAPDDFIVLFTDGVTEAMGEAMEEYTEQRLLDLLMANRSCSPTALIDLVQNDIENFTGPVAALSDDRTLIILKATET